MESVISKGYRQTVVGLIPDDWEVKPLGEIGDVRMCKRIFKHQTRDVGDVPFYKIGTFGDAPDAFITQALFDEFKRKYSFPQKGDILISAAGTIGRTVVYDGLPAYFQDSNIVWIDNDQSKATNEYLKHFYCVTKWSVSDGGTVARLYNDNLKHKIYVAIPPLLEQHTIVTVLSDMDALIEKTEKLIAKKWDIKQGTMQELLSGKCRLAGFSGEWEVKRFGDFAFPRRDRIDPRKTGVHDFCVELEHIASASGELLGSTSTGEQSSLKSLFQPGDVLFGKLRAYLRKYWLATRTGVCSTELWVLTPKDQLVKTEFLFQLIKTDDFIEAASNSYGTHMPRSDWNIVKNYEVAVPPLPEQTAIAEVLSDMDTEITALKRDLQKYRDMKQGMMQELLTGRTRLPKEVING
jgi:type I restriction enzyme S subunit